MSQRKSHYVKQNIIEAFDEMTAFTILSLLVEVVIVAVFTPLFNVEMSCFVVMGSLFTILSSEI